MVKKFYCQYDEELPHVKSNPGSPIHQTYTGVYDENGVIQLIPDKVVNTYDEIQAHRNSTDLNILLRRYLSGDTECLNKVQGVYGDFSVMPRSYSELLNKISDGQKLFDSLAPKVKAEFGNSYEQFLVAMQHDDFWFRLSQVVDRPFSGPAEQSLSVDVSKEVDVQ